MCNHAKSQHTHKQLPDHHDSAYIAKYKSEYPKKRETTSSLNYKQRIFTSLFVNQEVLSPKRTKNNTKKHITPMDLANNNGENRGTFDIKWGHKVEKLAGK